MLDNPLTFTRMLVKVTLGTVSGILDIIWGFAQRKHFAFTPLSPTLTHLCPNFACFKYHKMQHRLILFFWRLVMRFGWTTTIAEY